MTALDSVKGQDPKKSELGLESSSKALIEKLSPQFNENTMDIQEIMKHSANPLLLSVLLFKLAEERQKSNKILEQMSDRYDKIMFELKTNHYPGAGITEAKEFELLPEQDQLILKVIGERGSATANDIQATLNYRGLNAASQRLNRLYKDNYLRKAQSGRKVLYLIR
ncbi:MAG: hypothetical protein WC602_04440 [archaeon]